MDTTDKLIKVASSTDSNKLAGSIYSIYQENAEQNILIRCVGAGSLNQAIKAVIISNKFFAKKGVVVATQPSFKDIENNMTAIELKILFLRN